MALKIFLEKKVKKQLEKSQQLQQRIVTTLHQLEHGFSPRLDIKKLQGTKNHYRIRVGSYRILFVLESDNVYVYDVSNRSQAYK